MAAKKAAKPNTEYLEKQAEEIRAALAPSATQGEVFRAAAEAGYLTALADGSEDDVERAALVSAIEVLSKGFVVGWETETFLDEAAAKVKADGAPARFTAVGKRLAELGHAEAGLLIGATVAHASGGIDKAEAQVLEKIGAAAGVGRQEVASIVKKARG